MISVKPGKGRIKVVHSTMKVALDPWNMLCMVLRSTLEGSCTPHPCVNPCSPLDPVFLSMDLLGLPSAPMQLTRGAIGAGDPCVRAVCHYAHISCAIADARSWHPDPCYMTYCLYIQAKYCRHYCLFHYIQSPWTFMGVQLKQFIETSAKWLLTCPVAFTCALHLFACSYHDVKLQYMDNHGITQFI